MDYYLLDTAADSVATPSRIKRHSSAQLALGNISSKRMFSAEKAVSDKDTQTMKGSLALALD